MARSKKSLHENPVDSTRYLIGLDPIFQKFILDLPPVKIKNISTDINGYFDIFIIFFAQVLKTDYLLSKTFNLGFQG